MASHAVKIDCTLDDYPQATFAGVTELTNQNFDINVHELTLSVTNEHKIIDTTQLAFTGSATLTTNTALTEDDFDYTITPQAPSTVTLGFVQTGS